jgi:hypothetical protein
MQKLVIETGGGRPGYLGPPETGYRAIGVADSH